jgi:peptidoglycan/xylan/chitin deacetylase (PgdA/CDA1 family)
MSVREYGPSVGVPRILDMLDELEIPASFYIPGYVAETHEEMVREVFRRGHEIAHHGDMHEPPYTLSREQEGEVLDRGSAILEGLTGQRPTGYRAPAAELSEHSLELLVERGFTYDTTLMGNDIPYLLDGGTRQIVEIPFHWELVDVAYFNYAPPLGIRQFMATPEHVYQVWSAAFEGSYHYGLSMVPVMHPYVIGRPGRLRMLARLIRYMQGFQGVSFMRAVDVAEMFAPGSG